LCESPEPGRTTRNDVPKERRNGYAMRAELEGGGRLESRK
jgi:hypothetical protein